MFLSESPAVLLFLALLLGACIGSFLNVVIHRLPIMMYKEWITQCDELHKDPMVDSLPDEHISLTTPGSFCPSCEHPIHLIHNIPILSYLLLRARCKFCGGSISPRYFIVELVCGLLCAFIVYRYGLSGRAFFTVIFTFLLIPLIFIDIQHKLLPDNITYFLLWGGVLFSLFGYGINLRDSMIGVIAGYLSLWSVYVVFKFVTGTADNRIEKKKIVAYLASKYRNGREGMGFGDFKLLAALGAWVGWQQLLSIILISSIAGTLSVIVAMSFNGGKTVGAIPFGPFLAVGGWITLLWGSEISRYYFSVI